jgi:hypothetical protein
MIVPRRSAPRFTADRTRPTRILWPTYVVPLVNKALPLHWLEIGSFEGGTALWTVENLFAHPDSRITCIDRWAPLSYHDQPIDVVKARGFDRSDFDYEQTFDHNISDLSCVIKRKGMPADILPDLSSNQFHGCYINNLHSVADVMKVARLVLPLMLPWSVIVFDDSQWPIEDSVRQSVDLLLNEWSSRIVVVYVGCQVIFQIMAVAP